MSVELENALRPIVARLVAEALGREKARTPGDIRRKAGFMTVHAAALVAGVHAQTLMDYETGRLRNFTSKSLTSLKRLADTFGVTREEYETCILEHKRRIKNGTA